MVSSQQEGPWLWNNGTLMYPISTCLFGTYLKLILWCLDNYYSHNYFKVLIVQELIFFFIQSYCVHLAETRVYVRAGAMCSAFSSVGFINIITCNQLLLTASLCVLELKYQELFDYKNKETGLCNRVYCDKTNHR